MVFNIWCTFGVRNFLQTERSVFAPGIVLVTRGEKGIGKGDEAHQSCIIFYMYEYERRDKTVRSASRWLKHKQWKYQRQRPCNNIFKHWKIWISHFKMHVRMLAENERGVAKMRSCHFVKTCIEIDYRMISHNICMFFNLALARSVVAKVSSLEVPHHHSIVQTWQHRDWRQCSHILVSTYTQMRSFTHQSHVYNNNATQNVPNMVFNRYWNYTLEWKPFRLNVMHVTRYWPHIERSL